MISISFSLFHDETDNVIDHSKSLGYFLLPSSPISKSIRVSSNLFLDFWHKRKASTCIFHHKKTVRSSKSASFYVAKCIITSIFSSLNYSLIFWKIPQIAWKSPIKWDGIIDLFSTLTANKKSDTLQTKNYWKEYQKKEPESLVIYRSPTIQKVFDLLKLHCNISLLKNSLWKKVDYLTNKNLLLIVQGVPIENYQK